jgi:hypothetical protein
MKVIEINVGSNENASCLKEPPYFRKLLSLKLTHILENTLRDNYVETSVAEPNGVSKKICLKQIWRRIVDCYVDAIVGNVVANKARQRCRPTSDVEKFALPAPSETVHNSRRFCKSKMRPNVFQVLGCPEVPLVVFVDNVRH